MRQLLIAGPLALAVSMAVAAPVAIVEDGQPRAVIVLDNAWEPLQEAAAEMQACLEEASGAKLEIVTKPVEGMASINIGGNTVFTGDDLDLADLDDDGFVIDFPAEDSVQILGPTAFGTEFGVYDFLERYVGVRWLLPGESGRDVPPSRTITVPDHVIRDEPAFFSRTFSGLRGEAQTTWARRNRRHGRIAFHHNLLELFPPETYTLTHPEFFPLRGEERFLPPTNDTHSWQPCFTAPGIVDEAIANIVDYFDRHPDVPSYSLGVNDSGGHCQCESCRARDPGRQNLLGRDHLSDRYFEWANAVVEGVLAVHPDKYFGCLAYSEIFEPPDRVQVHERIIPHMTYDRMKWAHEGLRAEGQELTRRWAARSPTLGWYDYIYGTPYCLPRVWFHQMADYYRFGYENGVRCLYAEAYPNWGEGPKLYVALKLQWDPYRDVDELLDEWYERCVGPEAAPYLKRYYAHWEDFWTRRILDSPWFSEEGQYLAFHFPDYLADIDLEEIAASREWLEAAVAKAGTDRQRARAELLLRAFEYYEASAIAYPRGDLAGAGIDSEEKALAVIDSAEPRTAMADKRRRLSLVEFADHPVLVHPLAVNRGVALTGEGWGATSLWRVFEWIGRSDAVHSRIGGLAETADNQAIRDHARIMLSVADGTAEPINPDPSFEEDGTWSLWVKEGIGSMGATAEQAHSGERSVLCEGMRRGGPNQTLAFEPGRYAAVCFAHTPEDQQPSGTIALTITPRDGNDENLPSFSTTVTPQPGRWQAVAMNYEIPPRINDTDVATLMFLVVVSGLGEQNRLYLDDVMLFRLGPLDE